MRLGTYLGDVLDRGGARGWEDGALRAAGVVVCWVGLGWSYARWSAGLCVAMGRDWVVPRVALHCMYVQPWVEVHISLPWLVGCDIKQSVIVLVETRRSSSSREEC